jgi:hypothetical protein
MKIIQKIAEENSGKHEVKNYRKQPYWALRTYLGNVKVQNISFSLHFSDFTLVIAVIFHVH